MPVKVYKLIEKEVNGVKEKKYYSIDTDEYFDVQLDDNRKLLYFDTDSNKILEGKELDKFLKNNPDFNYNELDLDEDLEEVKDYDINVMFIHAEDNEVEKNRIKNKYNFIFETANMADLSALRNGMKLDPSKRFQDQKVDQSMFNKAVKYQYHDVRYGHNIVRDDVAYVGISSLFKAALMNLGYNLYLKNDEDLTFKDKIKKRNDREDYKDAYFDSIEMDADELGLEGDEKVEYINKRKREYSLKYENLIYNNNIEYGILNDSDYEIRAKIEMDDKLADPEKEMPLIEAAKLGVLAGLLGYGDPRLAFTQFLDKEAFKKNEYKYDDKAIDSFIKNIKITEKEKEDMVYDAFDHQAFYTMFDKAKEERDTKEFSFDEAVEYGKKITLGKDEHSHKYYCDVAIEYKKYENYTAENKRILNVAKLYNDMKFVRDKKPWYYVIAHPIKAYREYECKNDMKNFIKENLVKGTDFEKKINNYLDCSIKDQNKLYNEALNATKEPYTNPIYNNKKIALDELSNKSLYDKAEYTELEKLEKGIINKNKDIEEKDKQLLNINDLDIYEMNIDNNKSKDQFKETEIVIDDKEIGKK